MNILLWVLQVALAFVYLMGGAYKVFQFDQIASQMSPLSRAGTGAVGVLEMLGAVLLVVPAAMKWRQGLTPLAAAVLALESLVLAPLYARHSLELTAANPLIWSVVMGVL